MKDLKKQIKSLEKELEEKSEQVKDAQRQLSNIQHELKELRLKANPPEVKVTDHAVVRFLQYVHGVDIEAIRNEILTDYLKNMILRFKGVGTIPNKLHNSDCRAIVKNYTIVTIEPTKEWIKRKSSN